MAGTVITSGYLDSRHFESCFSLLHGGKGVSIYAAVAGRVDFSRSSNTRPPCLKQALILNMFIEHLSSKIQR